MLSAFFDHAVAKQYPRELRVLGAALKRVPQSSSSSSRSSCLEKACTSWSATPLVRIVYVGGSIFSLDFSEAMQTVGGVLMGLICDCLSMYGVLWYVTVCDLNLELKGRLVNTCIRSCGSVCSLPLLHCDIGDETCKQPQF